ncbi:SH2 domain-containing protein 4A isoform X1 [Pungitius pungitius]|uniref:SH2 domain-containing protein 4A isoform X1 n=1 Tax=Pungitius pungitius TaxID=134920 RepID=UPI0018888723|nr:SH2 domain-containing protein 4A isoform X1 [Pungitius pungitius]XP_037318357.1 SH2 domain-containing protein 4A isoform X1 [Pungitius pungitius]
MLAKILEDMWVEPEVLEALSEEQKRILFLKMREEQVRRWTEREEREEGEPSKRPKKADNKHVRWLLGRDGDVSVIVIGEVDEFRSSKLLQSLMNNSVHSDHVQGVQAVDLLPARESTQLTLKEELPLADVLEAPSSPHDNWSEEDSCSAEDDPKDPAEDSGSESGGSSDTRGDWTPLRGPRVSSHGNRPPPEAQLSDAERAGPQDREKSQQGGRVAQLKKQFADDAHSPPACTKPPVPTKPAHLQRSSALVIQSD